MSTTIKTHYRPCIEYVCGNFLPEMSDELRCPGCKAKREAAADGRAFVVAGETFTAAQMVAANAEDAYVCEWVQAAKIGDVLPDGEGVECVAGKP